MPALGALILLLFKNNSKRISSGCLVGFSVLTFLLIAFLYPLIISNDSLFLSFPSLLLVGISFKVDILSYLMGIVVSFIWIFISLYSLEYMKKDHAQLRFYVILLLNLAGTIGFFFAGDIVTMFLFFEVLTVFAYILVVHEENKTALRAGNRYIFLSLTGGLGVLFSILATYLSGTSLFFVPGGVINEATPLISIAFFIFLLSFGVKAGIFPFHIWLPIAHPSAPSPASALLSGIMIKTGAYGMIRVMYNLYSIELIKSMGWNKVMMVIAGITIFLGSAAAINENDIKRRLAYSSISQMGYIFLGMGLFNEAGLTGDIFHIVAHALMKSCLFLAAGAIIYKTGKRNIDELAGIGKEMPITMLAFTTAALAMIGIPPLVGFITKWELSLGILQAGYPYYIALLLLSSLMNAIYYFPIIVNAFFRDKEEKTADKSRIFAYNEVSWKMLIPMIVLALGTFIFDIIPYNIPFDIAQRAAVLLLQ
ncbi:MAG: complex I subunit 5 family protein [Halanaerobiales bacterium]